MKPANQVNLVELLKLLSVQAKSKTYRKQFSTLQSLWLLSNPEHLPFPHSCFKFFSKSSKFSASTLRFVKHSRTRLAADLVVVHPSIDQTCYNFLLMTPEYLVKHKSYRQHSTCQKRILMFQDCIFCEFKFHTFCF